MIKPVKILLTALAVLILGASAFGLSGYLTNGYESVLPLYLKTDGKVIKDALAISGDGQTVEVLVKSAGFDKAVEGYTVQITPNPAIDFDYVADGKYYRFSGVKSLNNAFGLRINGNRFGITGLTIQQLLSAYHNGAEIVISVETEAKVSYFKLAVQTASGSASVAAGVMYSFDLKGLDLDMPGIILG